MGIEFKEFLVDRDILSGRYSHLFQRKFLKKWDPEVESFKEQVDWFSSATFRVVEVGVGKGRFIIESAKKFPEKKFLGFEIVNKSYRIAFSRAKRENLKNLLIVRRHAVPVISFNFPDEFVDEYFFLYPDPWPKRRHRRRRWYFHPFFIEVIRTLKRGGTVTFTSDSESYVNEAFYLFKNLYKFEIVKFDTVPVDYRRTHFEEKFLKRGLTLYEIVGKKI